MNYTDERFADIQMLRYRLNGFEELTLQQKKYIYYLSLATLAGRDITFDQCGKYNLRVRKTLEAIYTDYTIDRTTEAFRALEVYLKRVWFSNGVYHHYGCEKFKPGFSEEYLHDCVMTVDPKRLPLMGEETPMDLLLDLRAIIFDDDYLPKRVNKADGEDVVKTSACNYYANVSQEEVETFYAEKSDPADPHPPSWGLNSTLVKKPAICCHEGENAIEEVVWKADGMYGKAISQIIHWLTLASKEAENDSQRKVIGLLIDYYRTGDLRTFDKYSIEWLQCTDGQIDFINGFIEVYGDPLGIKASWEGIVEYKDMAATRRTQTISDNAQWFEDHSPVDPRFKKAKVNGVTANVVCAAMLGGDEYPSTAIGINLPNADWIRAEHGSKSVTICNLTDAYNKAAKGSGMKEEFVADAGTVAMIEKYGDVCDDLHTDLHECLGHGSGQMLPGVPSGALKAYSNTIEEARADLFALYYLADEKLVELGLVPDCSAYKANYYTYIMNGALTQLVRIKPGNIIEEAHMRNRALIARWCIANGDCVRLVKRDGKTFVEITDYEALRTMFATLLAEIQRIKSEGDYDAARNLVETYGVNIDGSLHEEILDRYNALNIAPYKGFINPVLIPVRNTKGEIIDITVDYNESYAHQMLRYSSEFGTLV
ncbi:MAG: dihydrofolate reductase [Prevotella sp.]|nr:dihydrofolate reductase [Prevotella sp.]